MRDLLLLHTATLVAAKEIRLTHTLTFDNVQNTLLKKCFLALSPKPTSPWPIKL